MLDTPPEGWRELLEQAGPAIVGTAVSMLFTKGTLAKRFTQCAVGVPFSMYVAPSVGRVLIKFGVGLEPEAVGVLTAVFGLALVSYAFEVGRQLHLGPMIREWLANRLGVKGKLDDV